MNAQNPKSAKHYIIIELLLKDRKHDYELNHIKFYRDRKALSGDQTYI